MSQDKVRTGARSSARPRMKSLNQPRKLPVTGHCDRPHASQWRPLGSAPDAPCSPGCTRRKEKGDVLPPPLLPSIHRSSARRQRCSLFSSTFCSLWFRVSVKEGRTLRNRPTKPFAGFCGRKPMQMGQKII